MHFAHCLALAPRTSTGLLSCGEDGAIGISIDSARIPRAFSNTIRSPQADTAARHRSADLFPVPRQGRRGVFLFRRGLRINHEQLGQKPATECQAPHKLALGAWGILRRKWDPAASWAVATPAAVARASRSVNAHKWLHFQP